MCLYARLASGACARPTRERVFNAVIVMCGGAKASRGGELTPHSWAVELRLGSLPPTQHRSSLGPRWLVAPRQSLGQ